MVIDKTRKHEHDGQWLDKKSGPQALSPINPKSSTLNPKSPKPETRIEGASGATPLLLGSQVGEGNSKAEPNASGYGA